MPSKHNCCTLANHLITDSHLNQEIKNRILECIKKIHILVEDKADLLIDKMIKAEIYGLSSDLFTYCLRQQGLRAQTLDTGKLIQINLERKPDIPYIQESIQQYIDENRNVDIFIAPLSICRNVYGEIDFMSEQRNDYYATVLATLFKADEILLSTPINHIYANRNCLREQHSLTYIEAEQLINSGVHLLYADCITLAARSNIVIRLTDTHDLSTERLYISSHDTGNSVKAILSQDSATFVRFTSLNVLPGYLFMGKILEVINKYQINVISMASSNVSISMMLTASRDTCESLKGNYTNMPKWYGRKYVCNTYHRLTLSVHSTDKNKLISSLSKQFLESQCDGLIKMYIQILYSSIFRYNVVSPIFNKRAASVLFPFVYSNTRAICLRSIAASSKRPVLSSEHS